MRWIVAMERSCLRVTMMQLYATAQGCAPRNRIYLQGARDAIDMMSLKPFARRNVSHRPADFWQLPLFWLDIVSCAATSTLCQSEVHRVQDFTTELPLNEVHSSALINSCINKWCSSLCRTDSHVVATRQRSTEEVHIFNPIGCGADALVEELLLQRACAHRLHVMLIRSLWLLYTETLRAASPAAVARRQLSLSLQCAELANLYVSSN
eukprot:4257-Heterococcus_DN1.PRE.4